MNYLSQRFKMVDEWTLLQPQKRDKGTWGVGAARAVTSQPRNKSEKSREIRTEQEPGSEGGGKVSDVAWIRRSTGPIMVRSWNLRHYWPCEASVTRVRRASRWPQRVQVPGGRRFPRGNLHVDRGDFSLIPEYDRLEGWVMTHADCGELRNYNSRAVG